MSRPASRSPRPCATPVTPSSYARAPPGRGKCPLTGPEGCAPAHDADLVVCALGYEGDTGREVLREMRTRYPSVPVLVEVPSEIDAELEQMLEG